MSDSHTPSPDEVAATRTLAGGWTKVALAAWGVPWPPPKGCRDELEGRWREEQQSAEAPPLDGAC